MSIDEIESLVVAFRQCYTSIPLGVEVSQFNVLDEMHANENAHTRVLVRLLRIPSICDAFIQYLAMGPRNDLANQILPFEKNAYFVDCFSDYVDARIFYNRKVIIIENKVRDAPDQDAQIDRYVKMELEKRDPKDIFVVYLTKDGTKKVQDYSFSNAKQPLGYNGPETPGRFIEINYKEHIVDWLKNWIKFSLVDTQSQPYLRSGLQQYLHYLEGPELLNVRENTDPYAKKLEGLRQLIQKKGVSDSGVAFTKIFKEYLLSPDREQSMFIEMMRMAIRMEANEANPNELNEWTDLTWDRDCVNHGYWWVHGFALQLSENFASEHAIRAIEFFPQRGVQYSPELKEKIAKIAKDHPFFNYRWDARSVYKFPVVTKEEAISLCKQLREAVEETQVRC